ncbi:MAG: MvaI/BcnI family restriction endonuclease [Bacteroidales bacterium]|jgi:hypothetical protein|nr:MvaI/BcnI family restriction endonuclease [Bacteroidales bacterium]MCK9448512.1 MvaI/BcnI family restriction endonuclease [Bacteroidales bacterium]MDD3701570.1 MvaI/BcnI family restriction endonuclease [Bacteroidales bacterium]MDY0370560.1 MvaI/BcnI family restriction endonuclease [Bacteroidales bacterium]
MNQKEIQTLLQRLKQRGFIQSHRKGATGIGYTLEQELELVESNVSIPDIGGRVELKATRRSSSSLVTLFTFNRAVWQLPKRQIIETYGYIEKSERQALYSTVFYGTPNPQGLSISFEKEQNKVLLQYEDEVLAIWSIYTIIGKFITKLERLLLVIADNRFSKDDIHEEFHYNEAYLLDIPDPEKFMQVFENGQIAIDLRMHLKPNGTVRNHGTGFRIVEKNLLKLYKHQRRLI